MNNAFDTSAWSSTSGSSHREPQQATSSNPGWGAFHAGRAQSSPTLATSSSLGNWGNDSATPSNGEKSGWGNSAQSGGWGSNTSPGGDKSSSRNDRSGQSKNESSGGNASTGWGSGDGSWGNATSGNISSSGKDRSGKSKNESSARNASTGWGSGGDSWGNPTSGSSSSGGNDRSGKSKNESCGGNASTSWGSGDGSWVNATSGNISSSGKDPSGKSKNDSSGGNASTGWGSGGGSWGHGDDSWGNGDDSWGNWGNPTSGNNSSSGNGRSVQSKNESSVGNVSTGWGSGDDSWAKHDHGGNGGRGNIHDGWGTTGSEKVARLESTSPPKKRTIEDRTEPHRVDHRIAPVPEVHPFSATNIESPTVLFSRATPNISEAHETQIEGDLGDPSTYISVMRTLASVLSSRQEFDYLVEKCTKFRKMKDSSDMYKDSPAPLKRKLDQTASKLDKEMEIAKDIYRRDIEALAKLPYNDVLFADFDEITVEKEILTYAHDLRCWIDDISQLRSLYPATVEDTTHHASDDELGKPPPSPEDKLREEFEALDIQIGDLQDDFSLNAMGDRERFFQEIIKTFFERQETLEEEQGLEVQALKSDLVDNAESATEMSKEMAFLIEETSKAEAVMNALQEERQDLMRKRDNMVKQVDEHEHQQAQDNEQLERLSLRIEGLEEVREEKVKVASVQACLPYVAQITKELTHVRLQEARSMTERILLGKIGDHRIQVVKQVDEKMLNAIPSLIDGIAS